MKPEHPLTGIPVPRTAPPKTFWGRWFLRHSQLDELPGHESTHPWYQVLWLTGVDYFSTLGYQPGIALLAAGALSPVATAILLAVTLLGALPTYAQVARRSYAGQGSIAMLENLLPGWPGKLFVLILLGFAGTDFVITMTLSAADAALHAVENPYLHPYLGDARLATTIMLLALLATVFMKGFREAIGLAMAVAVPYLLLNLIVIVRGVMEIARHPELLSKWRLDLLAHGDWTALLLASAFIFPKLALGMSGFETGVTVMPLVSGGPEDFAREYPAGRIRATRKLLASAAAIMSFMLITSSLVTTMLIPEEAYAPEGPAAGRAIAYLAHKYLGNTFGSIYDISTITILWFAGASAMAGLLNLIPRYLPRFGMAPQWVAYARPLVVVLFMIGVIVTVVFDADVEAQGGAYATGVLVLMLSASIAVALALWSEFREKKGDLRPLQSLWLCGYFWLISGVFGFTLVDNVIERPDGVIIASVFITSIILLSAISRYRRSTELRVLDIRLTDPESFRLWPSLVGKKVNAVPLRTPTLAARIRKEQEIRKYYAISGPLAFIHVNLLDDRSEFLSRLRVKVRTEGENYVVEVFGAVAIANTLAYLSELMDPISLFLGLSRQNLMAQALRYLLWGEGEVGLMVYTILIRYWEWTPEEDVRPLIFLMSE
ncbi:MAG: hypothetical protein HY314_17695 [Acidobacteria bacterium]|nr:hypothetical protein [Acidobacteriota bacterium]